MLFSWTFFSLFLLYHTLLLPPLPVLFSGRSWKVLKPSLFESMVMPLYFEYSNYHSFNRLVNAWSFRRVSSGPDRGSYYHELFLRGKPYLQRYMRRLPKTAKKLPMKKGEEPDFYAMDKSSPLPPLEESQIQPPPPPPMPSSFMDQQHIVTPPRTTLPGLPPSGRPGSAGAVGLPPPPPPPHLSQRYMVATQGGPAAGFIPPTASSSPYDPYDEYDMAAQRAYLPQASPMGPVMTGYPPHHPGPMRSPMGMRPPVPPMDPRSYGPGGNAAMDQAEYFRYQQHQQMCHMQQLHQMRMFERQQQMMGGPASATGGAAVDEYALMRSAAAPSNGY